MPRWLRRSQAPETASWTLRLYRHVPETRWFHRRVLRRRWRLTLMHVMPVERGTISAFFNRPTEISLRVDAW